MESPNEDYNMEISAEGDQASSGPSPTHPQGFDHSIEKESSDGNVPGNGAPDGDEMGPLKEKKMILDPSLEHLQDAPHSGRPDHLGESYRVPDSNQVHVPASVKEIKELKASLEVTHQQIAALQRDNMELRSMLTAVISEVSTLKQENKSLKETVLDIQSRSMRDNLIFSGILESTPDNPESLPAKTELKSLKVPPELHNESSKTSSNHAGTIKVHKIVRGKTFGTDEALLEQLNCKELQVEMTDRQGCDIIILSCPINSRVGSDVEFAMRQVSGDQASSGHLTSNLQKLMSLNVPSETKQGDQASSGHLTSNLQGFDHRTEKENSNGNLPVTGATNSDEVGPSKEKKMILDSSVNPLQVAPHSGRPDHPAGSYIVLDSAVSASFQEIKELKASLEVTHQQIAALQRDNMELRSMLTAVTSEVSTLMQENRSLKETVLDIQSRSMRDNLIFSGILESTPDNPKSLPAKTELKSLKVPPELHNESNKTLSSHAGLVKTVKVHKIVTGRTFGADEALLKQLNCKELQVKMTDRQGCDIIILFCPINSRVGSDVELAMSQVSGVEQVILILMHHTRDVDYSTAAKRWSETFDNVIFDVNILYHQTEPGLLKCLKNKEAISDICEELMQYSSSTNQSKSNWSWSIGSFFGRGK